MVLDESPLCYSPFCLGCARKEIRRVSAWSLFCFRRTMLLKECGRCKRLIPYGKSYCDTCEPIVKAERDKRHEAKKMEADRRYNSKRDPKYSTFYNSKEWRRLSAARVQADGFRCVKCGAWASEVDHIIPIQTEDGWTKRFDWDNLQSLCVKCHNEKHERFKSKRKKAKDKSIITI